MIVFKFGGQKMPKYKPEEDEEELPEDDDPEKDDSEGPIEDEDI